MDVYQRINQMDSGYYSITVPLTQRITRLPPFVKNTIIVYAAQSPVGYNREVFRSSGLNDLQGIGTYAISGFDLYCPDALRRTVWLNYIPIQQQIFFTQFNRDPKLYDAYTFVRNTTYNLYTLRAMRGLASIPIATASQAELKSVTKWTLEHRNLATPEINDITASLDHGEGWRICYIHCDFPYIFVTWQHDITGEYHSGFYPDIITTSEFVEYNPFAFTGRNSNVEYLDAKWNDKTGLKAVIIDHNDQDRIKELGWTPDTLLVYPAPEVYRYFVAKIADKLSALNESNVAGVGKELVEATFAFDNFLAKDKSSWSRIRNVNGPSVADLL
jgi:hypothetical protein